MTAARSAGWIWRRIGAASGALTAGEFTQLPRVSVFCGVAIYMYWNERDHPVPHFHALHAESRTSVSVTGRGTCHDTKQGTG